MEKVALQVKYEEGYERVLEYAKNEGLKYVALGFGNPDCLLKEDLSIAVKKIKSNLEKNSLTCIFTHAPYYDLLLSAEIIDEKIENAQRLSVLATKSLGADIIAFHPRSYIKNGVVSNEKSFKINKANLKPIVDYAKSLGVRVALENLCTFTDHEEKFYPQTSADLINLINALEGTVAVWDFGHAHLNGNNQVKDVLTLNKALQATHVHSNKLDNDYHLPPLDGTTKWEEIMCALKEINYDGFLTLEVDYNIKTVSNEFIKRTCEQVVMLYKMLKKGE